MHHNNSFVKKTKKGKVLKIVREHYLRDDIYSGTPLDPECDTASHKLSPTAPHYLLIDTNVALHQLDFLEDAAVSDVIVCSVVLEEVQHKNVSAYQRLRALCASPTKRFYVFANEHHKDTYISAEAGESPNDRNDRAIRVAAKWYADRLSSKMKVVLLTNDAANRRKAQEEGLVALGPLAYVRTHRPDAKQLLDLVAAPQGGGAGEDGEEGGEAGEGASVAGPSTGGERGGRPAKRSKLFIEHKGATEIGDGIKEGRYHQGVLRVGRFNPYEGRVTSASVGQDIFISGRIDMNRAFDGDVVAVELLPESQWRAPSGRLPGGPKTNDAAGRGGVDEADEEEEEEEAAGPGVFQVAPGDAFGEAEAAPAAEEVGGGAGGSATSAAAKAALAAGKLPTGRVVGVIRRNWRARGYCGSLKPPAAGQKGPKAGTTANVLFIPIDRRYPAIRIATRQADTLMDKRIVVAVDGWNADSTHPVGHYVRTLGTIGDKDTETEVILLEHDIPAAPFTPAVHDCVPPLPWSVGPQHLEEAGREDLRGLCICSVDPPGCKDIDDALHVRPLPNGNFEVGVHIADVTHFLRPGTAMDEEAARRATTTYLVQRRLDMLPKPLTEDICSLRGGQERLTFSVLWEMTPGADVVSTRFTRAVIKSRAALTYQEAQTRIDDTRLDDELTVSLREMNKLAKLLRRRRAERGALSLASPEVKFSLDADTQDPLDVGMYQVRETNQMVEELMLLANIAVAEKIARHFPSCSLLRRHPTPAPRAFDPVLQALASVGLTLDVATSKALAASLAAATRADDPYFNKLVRIMTTRCMTQAVYFGSGDAAPPEYHHYGLAAPIYTHFTSPIRRYADVVVHRLLAAALSLEPLPDSARDRDSLRSCSDNLNRRHHSAQLAGRASTELHTLIFFRGRTVVADARVTKVKANGLVVFIPKYGIEGPVFLGPKAPGANDPNNVDAAAWVLDEETQTVTFKDGQTVYRVFQPVAVRICVEEGVGRRSSLVLSLVPREDLGEGERVVP